MGLAPLALKLFGSLFGFTAILGTLGLIGLAINDSIVVLAALREHPDARFGKAQATEEVVFHATRHVLATTVTTIVGFVPLMLDETGFWPPLAICDRRRPRRRNPAGPVLHPFHAPAAGSLADQGQVGTPTSGSYKPLLSLSYWKLKGQSCRYLEVLVGVVTQFTRDIPQRKKS